MSSQEGAAGRALSAWGGGQEEDYEQRGFAGSSGFGANPCLLVVDLQEAFLDPAYRLGAEMQPVLDATERLLGACREQSFLIVYTTMSYHASLKDAGVAALKMRAVEELIEGSPGLDIHPQVAPRSDELVIDKKRSSAFFMTNLPALLIGESIDTVIVAGVQTSACVRQTVVDSCSYGFRTVVPAEAVADRAVGPHEANLFDMAAKYADVMALDDVIVAVAAVDPDREARRRSALGTL